MIFSKINELGRKGKYPTFANRLFYQDGSSQDAKGRDVLGPDQLNQYLMKLKVEENIIGFSFIDQKDMSEYVIRIDELIDEQGNPI